MRNEWASRLVERHGEHFREQYGIGNDQLKTLALALLDATDAVPRDYILEKALDAMKDAEKSLGWGMANGLNRRGTTGCSIPYPLSDVLHSSIKAAVLISILSEYDGKSYSARKLTTAYQCAKKKRNATYEEIE